MYIEVWSNFLTSQGKYNKHNMKTVIYKDISYRLIYKVKQWKILKYN